MILVIGQNAAWQKVCTLRRLEPGAVNRLDGVIAFGSSKGPNTARALAGIGAAARVVCYVGGANGRLFLGQLAREGIACDPVPIAAETRLCTTFADADGRCTEVIEPAPEVTASERAAFRALVAERLAGSRVLALMGTPVRGETPDCYRWLVRASHERGVPVVMDSAGPTALEALAERPEVLKVNADELAQFAGHPASDAMARAAAYRALRDRGVRWIVVTLGADGVEAGDGRVVLHAAVPRVSVVNSVGSGDAAAAGVAWSLHEALADGASPEAVFSSRDRLADAAARAAAMGTANCLNPVNGRVDAADYHRLESRGHGARPADAGSSDVLTHHASETQGWATPRPPGRSGASLKPARTVASPASSARRRVPATPRRAGPSANAHRTSMPALVRAASSPAPNEASTAVPSSRSTSTARPARNPPSSRSIERRPDGPSSRSPSVPVSMRFDAERPASQVPAPDGHRRTREKSRSSTECRNGPAAKPGGSTDRVYFAVNRPRRPAKRSRMPALTPPGSSPPPSSR